MEPAGQPGTLAHVHPSWHVLRGGSDNLLTSSTWCAVCARIHARVCAVSADTSLRVVLIIVNSLFLTVGIGSLYPVS